MWINLQEGRYPDIIFCSWILIISQEKSCLIMRQGTAQGGCNNQTDSIFDIGRNWYATGKGSFEIAGQKHFLIRKTIFPLNLSPS